MVKRTELAGGTAYDSKTYVWDRLNRAEERDSTGSTVKKRYFAYGQEDLVLGLSRFYARDHLGSIWETLDASGNTLASFSYDPWGRRTQVSGIDFLDMGFTGFYFHWKSGLNFALYRAFNPNLGRWLSRDPIDEFGGPNLYRYVNNNPIFYHDPNGTNAVTDWVNSMWDTLAGARKDIVDWSRHWTFLGAPFRRDSITCSKKSFQRGQMNQILF